MPERKVLWHSNSPWSPTGYGNQTALFAPRIAQHYPLQISSFYGLEGAPLTWNGIKVLPGVGGTYGNESIPHHVKRVFGGPRDGMLLTLMDVWVLDPKMCAHLDVVSWVPVDHDPAPPRVVEYFRQSGAVPLAMSRFGEEKLAEAGLEPLYCPHGVDTSVYRPVDKAEARQRMGVGADEFMVGMVAANKGNPSRKSFVAALEAFAELRKRHENAKLYLHTDVEGVWSGGVALAPVIQSLGIPESAIGMTDPYAIHFHPTAPEVMALFYSSMDVLLAPSSGEGFGIPLLEAQACGTPVITTDFSACREVVAAGWKVKGSRWWTPQNSWQALPHVGEIVEALEDCYTMPAAERAEMSERARDHALGYDVDHVLTEYMLPALEVAQERFAARTAPVEMKLREAA